MSSLLITSVLLASYSFFVAAQSQCPIKNGVQESCVLMTECDSSKTSKPNNTPYNLVPCGWSGTIPMVCCPTTKCLTPDGEQGTCIHASSCPRAVSIYQDKALTNENKRNLLSGLWCEGHGKNYLCCSPSPTVQPTPDARIKPLNGQCVLTATPPEPDSNCCGRSSGAGSDRIVGGSAAAVDAYPWLTLIEYEKDNTTKFYCGGVLISGRYVLTAAHCVVGNVLKLGTPTNVRLGEYDTSKPGQDCAPTNGGGIDCTEGEVIVSINATIPHPDYRTWSIRQRNDIALIRLNRVVEYTAFIRPICLPSIDFTEAAPTDLNLYAAGWGATNVTQPSSNVKLEVALPYVPNQDCELPYREVDRRHKLWDGQLCAGGVSGKDVCKGDSGGPLQRTNGRFVEVVGVVSFGTTPCGIRNFPGVFTKITKYIPWIRSQIYE